MGSNLTVPGLCSSPRGLALALKHSASAAHQKMWVEKSKHCYLVAFILNDCDHIDGDDDDDLEDKG